MTTKTYTAKIEIETARGTRRQIFRGFTEDEVDGIRQNVRAITPTGASALVKVTEDK